MRKHQENNKNEVDLMDFLEVLWKRKWLIIMPTVLFVLIVGVISFLLPEKWKIESIIEPSKFFIQTEQGNFQEFLVSDPKQLAGEINNDTYDTLIAAELNIDIKEFPEIEAENVIDTNLLLISIKSQKVNAAKSILLSLFDHMKRDMDKKIDVEMSSINTEIQVQKNQIKQKNFNIKDIKSEIKLLRIEKNTLQEEILSLRNKQQISKERTTSLMQEMKSVKARIDKIEEQQRAAISEKQNEMNTLSLLLYSNEVQHNLRYYNTLDESLSNEKLTRENLDFQIKEKKEDMKKLDTEIEKKKTKISGINNEIENIENQINLLQEKKARIDYAQLIKAPTSTITPVAPKKKEIVLVAGFLGLFIFTVLAFLLEYIEKNKSRTPRK